MYVLYFPVTLQTIGRQGKDKKKQQQILLNRTPKNTVVERLEKPFAESGYQIDSGTFTEQPTLLSNRRHIGLNLEYLPEIHFLWVQTTTSFVPGYNCNFELFYSPKMRGSKWSLFSTLLIHSRSHFWVDWDYEILGFRASMLRSKFLQFHFFLAPFQLFENLLVMLLNIKALEQFYFAN